MRSLSILLLGLSACDGGGDFEPDTDPPADLPALCDDAPTVTWDNFGEGFVIEACQACHASTALDRHDAPPTIVFDTEDQVRLLEDLVLEVATGEAPTMPPQGGVSDEDRYLLEVWLTCTSGPSTAAGR